MKIKAFCGFWFGSYKMDVQGRRKIRLNWSSIRFDWGLYLEPIITLKIFFGQLFAFRFFGEEIVFANELPIDSSLRPTLYFSSFGFSSYAFTHTHIYIYLLHCRLLAERLSVTKLLAQISECHASDQTIFGHLFEQIFHSFLIIFSLSCIRRQLIRCQQRPQKLDQHC